MIEIFLVLKTNHGFTTSISPLNTISILTICRAVKNSAKPDKKYCVIKKSLINIGKIFINALN